MAGAAIGAGIAQGVGSIFDYFGGAEEREFMRWLRNYRKQMAGTLQGELGRPGISQQQINQFIPTLQKSLAPQMTRVAGGLSKRLGLDSPAAQGELGRQTMGSLYQQLGGFQQRATMYNAQRRQNILRMLASLGGGI